ncbi:cation transporter [Mycobacteroides chelonae]|uniref:phage tail protein n=1 Tax=Mycobacteroides chelonae TaxID=1774 RepID=UPI0009682F2E|nr:cation transporter [Mycobacteroides chelonae]OLT84037.1 cation transporter [Mycobacteroides chelonae]WED94028.1 cation transporter [Mycobacteroides chelonae]WED98149.1 cation transporter [Mycobacteroides chelonae]
MASAGSREVGRISVRVVPDTDGFRRALQRQLEAITKGIEAKVNVDPELNGFRQKVNAATKGMRTEVAVVPDVKTFRGHVKSMLSNVGDSLSNIKAPSFGSGINGTGYALIAAAIAALSPLVAGLLGALTTSLLALPGLITAAVVPIGALVLGLDGLKKAASVLKQPFDDLRATMSAKVQEQFTPVFEKLKDVFPTLKAALPAVTQGLADMARSFTDVLTSPENLAKLDQTIRNIASGLSAAAPGIRDFTQGFLDLINGFSEKLPDIGKWFSETGASFSKWVSEFTAKGPDGVSNFDVALGNLGDTLKIIGGGLVELAGKALDFFSDPEKVKSFKAELDGLINTVLTLADVINGLATVMSKIPGFGDGKGDKLLDFAPVQIQWIADMLPQIRQSVANVITEIIGMFAQVPAQLGSAWSTIVGIAQGVWNSVVQAVSSAISSVVSTIVSGGSQIMAEVGSWPGKIASALAGLFQAGFTAGSQLVQGFIQGIGSLITSAVAKATELASSVKNAVTGFLGIHSPSTVMADIGGFIGQGLIDGLKSKQGEIEKTAQSIGQNVKDAFDWSGYAQRGIDAGFAFAGANADQFMSDLGIGGKGLISQIGEQGLKFGTQLAGQALTQNFFTSNVDDTIAVKNNQLNRQSLGIVGRG